MKLSIATICAWDLQSPDVTPVATLSAYQAGNSAAPHGERDTHAPHDDTSLDSHVRLTLCRSEDKIDRAVA